MYQIYSIDTLKNKSLVQLKAIAKERGINPEGNKTYKQTWIDAIDKLQSNSIWRNCYAKVQTEEDKQPIKTESHESNLLPSGDTALGGSADLKQVSSSCLLPSTEFDVVGDEVVVDGVAIAEIAQDEDLTQPYFVAINGVEIYRDATWGKCFSYICWHYKQGTLPIPSEPADDYLFHDEQPIKLPQVGDSHFIGAYFLRCVQVGGEYAVVWDVSVDNAVMGEIRMGRDCF